MREGYKLVAYTQQPSDDPNETDEWGGRAQLRVDLPDLLMPFDAVKARPLGEAKLSPFEDKSLAAYQTGPREVAERALRANQSAMHSIGTDGTDLVWAFRDAAQRGRCFVFKAPWKADATALDPPTRVATLPCTELDNVENRTAVGCGYFGATTIEGRALVLRLKDGVAFHFPKLCSALDMSNGCATRVMGFTCRDAFFAVGGRESNVIRVPLDAMPNPETPEEPPRQLEEPDAGATTSGDAGAIDAGAKARDGG
jgi:hypothetical protein